MRSHIEDAEQINIVNWSKLIKLPFTNKKIFDHLIHIPNGGKRNPREAARLKRMGVRAGVSDLFLAWPSNGFGGLWIELKAPIIKGKPKPTVKPSQRNWLDAMQDANYETAIAFGWLEAMSIIKDYLNID
jgi:hypothetical protein